MCAINGFTFQDQGLIEAMNKSTAHRGPDASAIFIGQGMSLGHNRLSVIDLRAIANQPMHSTSGRTTIIFNGEIYNFLSLRQKLSNHYNFKTNSDTEVILAAYECWGVEAFDKFDGMFAFALYDHSQGSLFLVRDRFGVKPLYYSLVDRNLIFSSEIKGILCHPVNRQLDQVSLNHYFTLLYTPGPFSPFSSIKKLLPGCYLYYKDGRTTVTSFIKYQSQDINKLSYSDLLMKVEQAVDESVQGQLVSDRPLGIYLSGGIDSSIVLDAVSRKNVRGPINTFSVAFDLSVEEQAEKFNYDAILAKRTAELYGTKHHEFLISTDHIIDNIERAVWHLDEPVSNSTIVPMYLLAQFTKQVGVDVVLGGDGGDELFGGYDRYRYSLMADQYQKLPEPFRDLSQSFITNLSKINQPAGIRRYAQFLFQKPQAVQILLKPEIFKPGVTESFMGEYYFSELRNDFTNQFMATDQQTWLVDESLLRSDRLAMAHGLEGRVPFLSNSLAELAYSIPSSYKVSFWQTKKILKDAYRERLPEYLFRQPKRGWFSPGAKWLRQPSIEKLVRATLDPHYYSSTAAIFNFDYLNRIFDDHIARRGYHVHTLWSVALFQLWARQFKVTI